MKKLILATIFFNFAYVLAAQEQFIYTQISQKEGLTSTVNCIYKEKDSDVWLGSPSGLYRFNGYTLQYIQDSLFIGRGIYQIHKDKAGNFWVMTSKGLARRRAGRDRFEHVPLPDTDGHLRTYCHCEDEDGGWFGCMGRIYRYTHSDDSLRLFHSMENALAVHGICNLDEHTLLCCLPNGLMMVDKRTGKVSEPPYATDKKVSAAMVDRKGRVWVSLYNIGLHVYDKDGRLLRRYSTEQGTLSCDMALCMTEKDSLVWVGTDGGGLNFIDFDNDRTSAISHKSGDRSSFPAHSIKSIHTDHYGNIWAGSVRDGLIRVSQSKIKTYQDTYLGHGNGLSNPTVLTAYQDRYSDHIWVGTDGEGINRFDPVTREFTHYPETFKTKLVSIASYSEDELVVSLYSSGICLFNKRTGRLYPLEIKDKDFSHHVRYSSRSVHLLNESETSILLISNRVSRFDKATGSCTPVANSADKLVNLNYFIIGKTTLGTWLADQKGVYVLPHGEDELRTVSLSPCASIESGDIDMNGTIWLATDKGLCRVDPVTGEWKFIRTTMFKKAFSVISDRKSRIWVGTGHHVFAYFPDTDNFAMLGRSDGSEPNEYISTSKFLARSGDIYMGGVSGLLHIKESYQADSSDEPVLSLDEINVDGEAALANRKGVYMVPRDSKTLSIQAEVKEKDIFREKMFRFCISGPENIIETDTPLLTIRQMPPPGAHDITVSCSLRDGGWSAPVKLLTMRIPQPWYLSWWFILTSLLLALVTVATAFTITIRRKDNKLKMAMQEHEHKIYEEKVRMLINISHELRTPLTLIMAPLKRLIKETDPQVEEYQTLGRIYRQSHRMKDLLDMVLELRKLEVGTNSLKIERADFNGWLSATVEDVVNEEVHEGIVIDTDLAPEVGEVDFDRRKCDTVLMNILINAIKHSSAGDRITISSRLTPEGCVRVSVSDEGPGLRDIDKASLFTRFYQGNSEQYGSGIGLSYSKILVELHGGRIAAENNSDKGATFWWEIPVRTEVTASALPNKAYLNELMEFNPGDITAPESDGFSMAGMTLMLVDDNQDLLDFLREALSSEFGKVLTVTSGNSALRAITSGNMPDIIVSDVNMPDGDGYRLCHELKKNGKYSHIPFILLTARGEEQSQSDSYKMGADAFLAKPFEIETLTEMMKGLLRKRDDIRRKYLDTDKAASGSSYGSNEERFIIELNRIIAAHLSDPELDQKLICREMGLSRASLYNHMKSITGSGTKEYITRIRIEKAKSLIDKSGLSLAEISEMTGFASQSYFSTAFKSHTGQTPTQYKKTLG